MIGKDRLAAGLTALSAAGAAIVSPSAAAADSQTLVHTDRGPVRGILAENHRSFLDIPYARTARGRAALAGTSPHPGGSPPSPSPVTLGAYHAADLPYLFDVGYNQPLTNPQRHLPDHVIGYWTRFAPHGRPQRSQRTRLASLRYSTPPCPVPGPRR